MHFPSFLIEFLALFKPKSSCDLLNKDVCGVFIYFGNLLSSDLAPNPTNLPSSSLISMVNLSIKKSCQVPSGHF